MMEEKSDEKNSGCLLYVEGLIVLSLYMWYFDWGWIEWIIAYVVFSILTSIHFTRILVCLAMCGLWAYFAYGVFESWIVAVIAFWVQLHFMDRNSQNLNMTTDGTR